MPSRNHLDAYSVTWYGPGGHESHLKIGGLNLLSLYISKALRKAKQTTTPATHQIVVQFQDGGAAPELFQRHPKTVWLNWLRDYRELEALPPEADNATIGEFSIQIAQDLMARLQETPEIVKDVPFTVIERAVEEFRRNNYSFTSKLGPKKLFDASPLVARFFNSGDCTETKTTMVIFHGKTELHRQVVTKFGPGRWDIAKHTGSFDLYDNQIKFFSMDVLSKPPVINYSDLPESVQEHLPTNAQLQAEWKRQGF